jgi:hypothetical protein
MKIATLDFPNVNVILYLLILLITGIGLEFYV